MDPLQLQKVCYGSRSARFNLPLYFSLLDIQSRSSLGVSNMCNVDTLFVPFFCGG